MSIRIVSDSTCDLPQELVDRFQIKIVPAVICFGSQECLSGIDIDRELFYRKLEREDVVPTTSQPSPGQFLEAYNGLAHDGHSILSIRRSRIDCVNKARRRRKTLERGLELMAEAVGKDGCIMAGIGHANVPEEVTRFQERVQEMFNCVGLLVVYAGMAITSVAGPGLIAMLAYRLQHLFAKEDG